jgi:hypothetical protein
MTDYADAIAIVDAEINAVEDLDWTEGAMHILDANELTRHGRAACRTLMCASVRS